MKYSINKNGKEYHIEYGKRVIRVFNTNIDVLAFIFKDDRNFFIAHEYLEVGRDYDFLNDDEFSVTEYGFLAYLFYKLSQTPVGSQSYNYVKNFYDDFYYGILIEIKELCKIEKNQVSLENLQGYEID